MIFIGLGSSIGDAKKIFSSVEKSMRKIGIEVLQKSKFIKSSPLGGVAKNEFTNAVWEIKTSLDPQKLLSVLEKIEIQHGRIQKHRQKRWSDRTLDLDILIYHDEVWDTDNLQIPHPQMIHRNFVLSPLSELVDENFEIHTFGSISQILKNV